MGMFSEIIHEFYYHDLESILAEAIKSHNQYVIDFCKEFVIPLYQSAADDSWKKANEKLLSQFDLIKE